MIIITPGARRHTSTDGMELWLDNDYSPEVVDQIARLISLAELSPHDVCEVNLDHREVVEVRIVRRPDGWKELQRRSVWV